MEEVLALWTYFMHYFVGVVDLAKMIFCILNDLV